MSKVWDVFVSHNRKHKSWVRQLVRQLRALGLRVFFDEDNIQAGEDVVTAIEKGVESSRFVILVITPDAVSSPWVALETAIAVYCDPEGVDRRVIPVILEPTEPTAIRASIRRLSMIDLTSKTSCRQNYHALLTAIGAPTHLPWPDPPPLILEDEADETPRLTASTAIKVPRFHLGGVVPLDCFINREQELSEAETLIADGHSFLLVGDFREGKTSFCEMLLNRTRRRPANDVLAVYRNVQDWKRLTVQTFLDRTLRGILAEVGREVFHCPYPAWNVSSAPPAVRNDPGYLAYVETYQFVVKAKKLDTDDFLQAYKTVIEIISARGWNRCVVIYDEANRLSGQLEAAELFRFDEDHSFAGKTSVYVASPAMADWFLQMKRFYQVQLGPFHEIDGLRRLLAKYCCGDESDTDHVPATESALKQLWKYSAGRPYLIQWIAREAFEVAHREGVGQLSETHVEYAYAKLLRDEPAVFGGGKQKL